MREVTIGVRPISTNQVSAASNSCEGCSKQFVSPSAKVLHNFQVHSRRKKRRQCRTCKRFFVNLLALKRHDCIIEEPPPSKEELLIEQQPNKSQNKVDVAKEENELDKAFTVRFSGVKCLKCDEDFGTFENYRLHAKSKGCSLSNFNLYQYDAESAKEYKCQKCPQTFESTNERFEHLAQHLHCPNCEEGKRYLGKSLVDLRLHVKISHGRHPCYSCHLSFSTLSALKVHMAELHSELRWPDKSLKEIVHEIAFSSGCKRGQQENFEEKIFAVYPLLATEEDRVWRAKVRQILSSHFNEEENEDARTEGKKYLLCGKCASPFEDKASLDMHTSHCFRNQTKPPTVPARATKKRKVCSKNPSIGSKEHPCHCCDVQFHWKVDLRKHLRTVHHVGFQCQHCHQELSSLGFLRRHSDICKNKVLALVLGKEDDDDDDDD